MKELTLAVLSMTWLCLHSQQKPTISLCLSTAQPLGMFEEIAPEHKLYFGGSFIYVNPVATDVPISLGFEVSGYFLGSKSETFTFYGNGYNGSDTYQTTNVTASMWPAHFVARVDPVKLTEFPIQPYGGGLLGFRVFNSRTKVDISYPNATETDTYKKRRINFTSSYGFEIGAHIWITQTVGIDFRYSKVWGGWGKYVDFETLTFDEDGDPHYDLHETRTDIKIIMVGVVWLMTN